ncbi:thermonuclease family protein [Pseudomonas cavernae]|uniref:Thermonuclease family protein n=1 Tax=Pseudomonas cavernae TaxID=2320867 RepID=A0A385Z754_9PSED|nr:thermonuclease family protein [Pseudomonas cavernae]AYC34614.1 thermonuclease family protein [Pseudomonas cavernae]
MGFPAQVKKASLVGAFFVSVAWLPLAQAGCPLPGQLPSFKVQRVVDGDTLKLEDGRSVRLIGLNAPELAHQGRSTEPFAETARRRLQELVAANDNRVGLRLGQQAKDHYGRILAHAYDARGRNLEAELLAAGLGYQVAVAPNTALVVCQHAAEAEARQAGRGLWRQAPVQSPQQLQAGGFALIRARVVGIERNRGGLWLELDGPLVLHIAPKQLTRFDLPALQALSGRRIEARGWVIDRARRGGVKPGQARWMLPLTDAAMLEVLP